MLPFILENHIICSTYSSTQNGYTRIQRKRVHVLPLFISYTVACIILSRDRFSRPALYNNVCVFALLLFFHKRCYRTVHSFLVSFLCYLYTFSSSSTEDSVFAGSRPHLVDLYSLQIKSNAVGGGITVLGEESRPRP